MQPQQKHLVKPSSVRRFSPDEVLRSPAKGPSKRRVIGPDTIEKTAGILALRPPGSKYIGDKKVDPPAPVIEE
jgi:hypothetical protein